LQCMYSLGAEKLMNCCFRAGEEGDSRAKTVQGWVAEITAGYCSLWQM
jgi:hypothetical protein